MPYKFYGLSMLSAVIAFSVISAAMIALGGTQPPHPALRGFIEGCEGVPQPCWYGIIPMETTFADAVTRLTELGFKETYDPSYLIWQRDDICQILPFNDGKYINELVARPYCTGMRLGDVLAWLNISVEHEWIDCQGQWVIYSDRWMIFTYERTLMSPVERISMRREGLIPPEGGFSIWWCSPGF
jgi:hypothetical protein